MAQCKATTAKGTRCNNPAKEGSQYCHIQSHGPEDESTSKNSELNPKQERFCQLYVSKEFFGNGVQSYMEAYGIGKEGYDAARSSASDLLTNPNILGRINELLDTSGLNNEFVDKQLLFLITQSADFSQKMAAIREFNKVRGRIVDKIEADHRSSDGSMSPPNNLSDWYDKHRGGKD